MSTMDSANVHQDGEELTVSRLVRPHFSLGGPTRMKTMHMIQNAIRLQMVIIEH